MRTWFANITTIEELRKEYRKLLKQYHPDNAGGSMEATQEINAAYDRLFAILSKKVDKDRHLYSDDEKDENEAFKVILKEIIYFDMEIEIIGNWIWCFHCYAYRNKLKELGFHFAPKKKAWTWHYSEEKYRYRGQTDLEDIRAKYGSQKVSRQTRKQYSLD